MPHNVECLAQQTPMDAAASKTRIKACRIKTTDSLDLLEKYHIDFAGLHAINSLDPSQLVSATMLTQYCKTRSLRVEPVLLTKVTSTQEIASALEQTGVRWLQLHAQWPAEPLRLLRARLDSQFSKVRIVLLLNPYAVSSNLVNSQEPYADYFLIDNSKGGTGEAIRESALTAAVALVPPERTFIAGGLNPQRAADVIQRHGPYAVDVQSDLIGSTHEQEEALLEPFVQSARSVSCASAVS